MNKKRKILLCALALIVLALSAILILSKSNITESEINLDDIDSMNIGAQMPDIIYGDDDKLIMKGTFGIIFFDLHTERVYKRVPQSSLEKLGLHQPLVTVSENGKNIYIADPDYLGGSTFRYNVESEAFSQVSEIDEKLFTLENVSLYSDERYQSYVDPGYLLGSQVLSRNNQYLYLRANTDWSMKSLQLVIADVKTRKENVVSIFEKQKNS